MPPDTAGAEIAQLPRVPWSAIKDEFITSWGYTPEGKFQPEHIEILGPTGSGKTYAEATLLRERVRRRNSAVIFIATKQVDETILLLGWPIVDDWREVTKHRQVIFWPQSDLQGEAWEEYVERKIYGLLAKLWASKAKVVLVFDEFATAEDLSRRLRILIKRYWREGRSGGITIVAMKQRPQGTQRDMHSETAWILAFQPKDEDDGIRVAQVMGSRRAWLPVLMNGLDAEAHEFVLLNTRTKAAVITWIDTPLRPAAPPRRGLYQKVA
jgi:nucleoside-triphosphatase THEP1